MSSSLRKIAVAGATGSLGAPIVAALVKAGFTVTALTRDVSKAVLPPNVRVVSVDYSSEASLKQALNGQDALISALSSRGSKDDALLYDAAISEGVKRIIPSEFGSDTLSPEARALPVYKSKVELQEYIKRKIVGTNTTYTIVVNNAFLDWGLQHDFLFDRKQKKVQFYDGGDVPFTATPLARVADGVVGVLKHPAETENRVVKVHSITVTQKQLVALYQKHTTTEGWDTTTVDSGEALKTAYQVLQTDPSNFLGWGIPMLFRVALGRGSNADWSNENDNELLGVQEVSQAELEEYVKEAVV